MLAGGAEMMKPIMPPAADTLSMPSEPPPEGYGVPWATCTMPSTPTVRADQPMIIRPVSAFWSGWRSSRQASSTSRIGISQVSDAEDAAHDAVDHGGDRAGVLAPGHGGQHDRPGEHRQAEPVAAVHGVELARVLPQGARRAADAPGEQHPDAHEQLADHGEHPADRVMLRRGGPAARESWSSPGPGASSPGRWTPVWRGPYGPGRRPDRPEDPLPGGFPEEPLDVRVAMLGRLTRRMVYRAQTRRSGSTLADLSQDRSILREQ